MLRMKGVNLLIFWMVQKLAMSGNDAQRKVESVSTAKDHLILRLAATYGLPADQN